MLWHTKKNKKNAIKSGIWNTVNLSTFEKYFF